MIKTAIVIFCLAAALPLAGFELAAGTTISVLPFNNDTKEAGENWIGVGIAEVIQNMIAEIPGLRAVERVHMKEILDEQDFQQTLCVDHKETVKIGKLVGARILVIGSFQKTEEAYAISARAVDAETSEILGSAFVNGPRTALFELQRGLAKELCRKIRVDRLAPGYLNVIDRSVIPGLEELQLFAEGRMAEWQELHEAAYQKFKQAIDLNPAFKASFAGMETAYTVMTGKGLINQFKQQKFFAEVQHAMVRSFCESAPQYLFIIEPIRDMDLVLDPEDPSKGKVTIELRISLNRTFRGELRKTFRKYEGGSMAVWPLKAAAAGAGDKLAVFKPAHTYLTGKSDGAVPAGFLPLTKQVCLVDAEGNNVVTRPLQFAMDDYAWSTAAFHFNGELFEDGRTTSITFLLSEEQLGKIERFIIR